ncbi:MAG: hypothetical protein ACP5UA_11040 [Candidatus Hydrogenedens sp.]
MIPIKKGDIKNSAKFKTVLSTLIREQQEIIFNESKMYFEFDELGDLLLSACRMNDFDIVFSEGKRTFLNNKNLLSWIYEKIIPNTVIVRIDDEDIIRLLLFSMEITYQMFLGGTRATTTAKGFRERRRTFESILVDQFTGKLGEVMLKKFLEKNFVGKKVELDWEISRQIEKYRTDIVNSEKKISIKSSPSLGGIWAEADIGYDYGIMVKCSVPQQPILQFFVEVCGFTRLLNFAEDKIPSSDTLFSKYLNNMRERVKKYKCGEIQTDLKAIICGYFNTKNFMPVEQGIELPYLGVIREKRYLTPINTLKWRKEEWKEFFIEAKIR